MSYDHENPKTWPNFHPLIIAHDVGHTRDRSTAVVGGNSPFPPRRLGILDFRELPIGLYGRARASELAKVDRYYNHNALIVADLSNDATYAETLYETFGRRVIGLQISRHGDGVQGGYRPVLDGFMPVYTIGRSYLIELYHAELQSRLVRIVDSPMAAKAYAQLEALEVERRDSGYWPHGRASSPSYFVNMGLEDVGGVAAGERLNVSQRFQPAGRFSFANSP